MNAATLLATDALPPVPQDRLGIQVRRFAGPAAFVGALDHLRIAHLTDLHVGRVTPLRVQLEAADLANEARPDAVVITGDFVCHSTKYLDELTMVIQRLRAPVFCVLGNHDYWSGATEVRWALKRGGAEILDNAHSVVTLRGQRLQMLGLDDAYTGHASRARAVKGLRRDLPTIGLSHIAEEADGLWRHGVPLVLSGHTHAGQVTVARLHEISIGKIAGHKYVHGLYGSRRASEPETGAVYVGAGIGAAVIPFRVGDRGRREVTIFDLGVSPGAFSEHHDDQLPLPGRKPSPEKQWKRAAAVVRKERARESRTSFVRVKK
jgi:predicted MPP superfamily phosphohydrolase